MIILQDRLLVFHHWLICSWLIKVVSPTVVCSSIVLSLNCCISEISEVPEVIAILFFLIDSCSLNKILRSYLNFISFFFFLRHDLGLICECIEASPFVAIIRDRFVILDDFWIL